MLTVAPSSLLRPGSFEHIPDYDPLLAAVRGGLESPDYAGLLIALCSELASLCGTSGGQVGASGRGTRVPAHSLLACFFF